MNPRLSATKITQAAKELALDWEETKYHWRDIKSQEFERTYLENLPDQISRTKEVMDEIDAFLRKVRADCE